MSTPRLFAGPVATSHGKLGLSSAAKTGIGVAVAAAVAVIGGVLWGVRTINNKRMW